MPTEIIINGDFNTTEAWSFTNGNSWVIDTIAGTLIGNRCAWQTTLKPILAGKTYSLKFIVDKLQGGIFVEVYVGASHYRITTVGTHEFELTAINDNTQFWFWGNYNDVGEATISFVSCKGDYLSPQNLKIYPTYGPEAGGTEVTITGTNLDGVDGVEFDGIAATDFVWISSAKITCTTPSHQFGKVDVTLLDGTQIVATIPEGFFYGTPAKFVPMVKRDSATNKIMTIGKKIQTIHHPPCSSCEIGRASCRERV